MNMTFTISMMRQMCLLVAMLMMFSVSGRVSDNFGEAAETEPTMDDNTNNVRRQETTVCGRRQIPTWKRDVGKGGSNDDDHSDHLDKILGGSDVTYGQVPWHVNIYYDSNRICGGAIINEFWIITSASCVYGAPHGRLTLVVGDHRLSHRDLRQGNYKAQRVVIHTVFRRTSDDYDIALIKVKPRNGNGIFYNINVQPICLPVAGESPAANVNLTVSGWGDLASFNTQFSNTLQTAVLPVFNHNQCINAFLPGVITDRIMCAGRTNGTTDVCLYDYGGPATIQSGDTHILAGIIIKGSLCIPPIIPARLSNVLVFRPWINDRINQYSYPSQRLIPMRGD